MSAKEPSTFLGLPVEDRCPCGRKVKLRQRQEFVLDKDAKDGQRWLRVCQDCIINNRGFEAPPPPNPAGLCLA